MTTRPAGGAQPRPAGPGPRWALLPGQAGAAGPAVAAGTGTRFPEAFRDDAFAAMRSSWNRDPLTRYVHIDAQGTTARLAATAVAVGWALLVTDEANGVRRRIGYPG